jgi:TetR/AcrR family transcriptional regulator, regulator of cefoperazone and chloramphenicol sensitivity
MAKTVSRPIKRAAGHMAAGGGYRKGEETRQRILDMALKAFGDVSYKAATTRRIAEAAGVSLPTLQYYFGDKEGLYRACAEAIVDRFRHHTRGAAAAAEAMKDGAAETARLHLKAVIRALAGFLVGSREAEGWAQFVARELRDPGPAFEILYDNLWGPGVLIAARLIARILGVPEDDPVVRVRALLLISSALAFQSGRRIVLRTMRWPTIGPKELVMVLAALDAQIDALGRQERKSVRRA